MTGQWLILIIAVASMAGACAALTCQRIAATTRGECPACGKPRTRRAG